MDDVSEGTETPPARPAFRLRRPLPPRPPIVRDWRWGLGLVGKVFITLGLLIFAFVGYQLWGTGIEFRANQRAAARDFRHTQESLGVTTTVAAPTTIPPTTGADPAVTDPNATDPAATDDTVSDPTDLPTVSSPDTTLAPSGPGPTLPPVSLGDVVAALKMPTITSKTYYVIAGVRVEDLKRGVGHYPGTPLPGQYGNAALAGHRTTYGAPFENLDKLKTGDRLIVDTPTGQHYEYVVDMSEIISPKDTSVLMQPDDRTMAALTLTTCHPKHSTKQRLVIHSHLDASVSSPLGARTSNYRAVTTPTVAPTTVPATVPAGTTPGAGSTPAPVTTAPATTAPATTLPAVLAGDDSSAKDARDLARGWFHDHAAWLQIAMWGAALIALCLASWRFARWMGRRWLGPVVAAVPFVVLLYFFFQNINRLLPPGL